MTIALQGICASKGVAIGHIYIVDRGQLDVNEYLLAAKDVDAEVARFLDAVGIARNDLRAVRERIPADTSADIAAFIDTHLLMLEDSALTKAPIQLIRARRCNAEWALKLQRDALVSVFEEMDDPYLRTRKDDVEHVVARIQRILLRQDKLYHEKPDSRLAGQVVLADDLTPADTVLLLHQGIAGFITEYGGPTSHTAILGRSLGIPAVVGLHQARLYLRSGDMVVVDGRAGAVLVDPDEHTLQHYRDRQQHIKDQHALRDKLRGAPTRTLDGTDIVLQANIELPEDVDTVLDVSADGVGLYRTEFLFMNRDEMPGEEEQYQTYRNVVEALGGAPVTLRTLDMGADKTIDGGRYGSSWCSNPALGLRAVRLCLSEPALFRPQLRAILRASQHGPVRLLVPMLSNTEEVGQVLRLLADCRRELQRDGHAFDAGMPVGAMVEVPAAALCADLFARQLDFLSIGTNDLIQYTIATDRVDDEVNYLYDPLHPAVLRLIKMTIKAGESAGVSVSMCGEMAGNARYTRLLLGMGLREFSVPPNTLLEIKQVINTSDAAALRRMAQRVLRAGDWSKRAAALDRLNSGGG
ncbi:MAG: phosphoenolpyruvate--protein phosphotransferase [Gammaproteobacteria bacterium]|nr:phosphoenolpyruvate--protein phosphotransferase [Gammaproteobacteria bacterium]